jgi:hypothetical protein
MKIKKSNMSYFAPSPKPVLSRCCSCWRSTTLVGRRFFQPHASRYWRLLAARADHQAINRGQLQAVDPS